MVKHIWPPRPEMMFKENDFEYNAQLMTRHGVLDVAQNTFIKRLVRPAHLTIKPRDLLLENTIPIMVNDKGQIVCIPLTNDEPNIGIFGQKGKGKTFMQMNILSAARYNCGIRCGVISDETGESTSWARANTTNIFREKLKVFRQKGTGLPIVILYPHLKDGVQPKTDYCPVMRTCYSWEDFLDHPVKLKDLKGSQEAFENIKEHLKACTDIKEINELIESRTIRNPKKDKKMTKEEQADKMMKIIEEGGLQTNTANKLKTMLKVWWHKEIFDIATNIPSKLTLHTPNNVYKNMEPFSALLLANLIPSLYTARLSQEEYFENYFENFLEKIFYSQTNEGTPFSNNKLTIWLFCDEMNHIPKLEIIDRMFREGRPNRIGFVYSCQEPDKLSPTITKQSKYFIVFRSSKKDMKPVIDQYDLTDAQMERIRSQQEFQCCLLSNDPVLIYDTKTNKVYKESIRENPQFGGIFFPTCQPRKPGEGKVEAGAI